MNKKTILMMCIIITSMLFGGPKTKFSDQQIAAFVPKYFARDHHAPNISRIRIYAEDGKKVFHLEIDVNRNRYEGQMDYTVSAMASLAQYAKIPFDTFIVIMHPSLRDLDSELIEANATCSINYFVRKKMNYDKWMKNCTKISPV
ncbi:MAG: hypothetical protein ISR83_06620 [Candidatus Marinimicrobia bacterium]|nr:hypothetical protein [Candidatus Neomarinimicrobiota bacterium]